MGKFRSRDYVLRSKAREKLLSSCESELDKFVTNCLLYTGLRAGEFVHMKRSWIDFDENKITIPEDQPCECSIGCKKRGNLWKPKTSYGIRVIPILPELEPILKSFFESHEAVQDCIKHRQKAWEILKDVAARAKIEIFPHALRATFATMLGEKLCNPLIIRDALGWKDIKMAETYCKLAGEAVKKGILEKW